MIINRVVSRLRKETVVQGTSLENRRRLCACTFYFTVYREIIVFIFFLFFSFFFFLTHIPFLFFSLSFTLHLFSSYFPYSPSIFTNVSSTFREQDNDTCRYSMLMLMDDSIIGDEIVYDNIYIFMYVD